jgi:hypothetical protein
MTDLETKRGEVEPEQEEDRGTIWALPTIVLVVAAIMLASPVGQDRMASNDPAQTTRDARAPAPVPPPAAPR